MSDIEENRTVCLRLTHAEAIVLFDWISRVDAAGNLPVEDPAEEQVLWLLEGQLESKLIEPLRPDYKQAVEEARKRVRGSHL